MTLEKKFILSNVSPNDFSDWLRKYFFKLNQRRFPNVDDITHKVNLYKGRFELDVIPRYGNFHKREYTGEVRGIGYTIERITNSDPYKIRVTIECRNDKAKVYFNELVTEINQLYEHNIKSSQLVPEQAEPEKSRMIALSKLEQGIIQAAEELSITTNRVTDNAISIWLADKGITNSKGNPYTREHINRIKNRLKDKGYKLEE